MPDEYVTRVEYEARHANLEQRVSKVEATIDAYRTAFDAKLDKISDKVGSVETNLSHQIGSMKDAFYRDKSTTARWAIGALVSFLTGGGGMIGLLQVFHLLR